MILELLIYSVTSFITIYIIHYLYYFLKENLTTPQIKDMVERPYIEYERIYKTIYKDHKETVTDNDTHSMKNELKNYLSNLTNKENTLQKVEEYNQPNTNQYTKW